MSFERRLLSTSAFARWVKGVSPVRFGSYLGVKASKKLGAGATDVVSALQANLRYLIPHAR